MTYLNIGCMCGEVAHSFCAILGQLSDLEKCHQNCLILTAQSLHSPWLLLVVFSLPFGFLEMCHSWTHPPYIQVCHCMWQVLSGLFPVLILQAANTGVRRLVHIVICSPKSFYILVCYWLSYCVFIFLFIGSPWWHSVGGRHEYWHCQSTSQTCW